MLAELLSNPERARSMVYLLQAGVGVLFLVGFFWLRNRDSGSSFRAREFELRRKAESFRVKDQLGQAKLEKKKASHAASQAAPLRLAGISLVGAPHEILGIQPGADEKEIQKAYRDLMKRYHPDAVGRPGTREWQDAQKIAEVINGAKETMISSLTSRKK